MIYKEDVIYAQNHFIKNKKDSVDLMDVQILMNLVNAKNVILKMDFIQVLKDIVSYRIV